MFKHKLRAPTYAAAWALREHLATPVPEGLTARRAYMAKCAKIINSWGYLKAKVERGENNEGKSTWFCEVNEPSDADLAKQSMFGKYLVRAGKDHVNRSWIGPVSIIPGWDCAGPARVQETAYCQAPSALDWERGFDLLWSRNVQLSCAMMLLVSDAQDAFDQLMRACEGLRSPETRGSENVYGWTAIQTALCSERRPSQRTFQHWYQKHGATIDAASWEHLIPLANPHDVDEMRAAYEEYLHVLKLRGTEPWPRYIQRSDTWNTHPDGCHPLSMSRLLDDTARPGPRREQETAYWWLTKLTRGWGAGEILRRIIEDPDDTGWRDMLLLSPRQLATLILVGWIDSSDNANPVGWSITSRVVGYLQEYDWVCETSLAPLAAYLQSGPWAAKNRWLSGKGQRKKKGRPARTLTQMVLAHHKHWGRTAPELVAVLSKVSP